MSREYKSRPSRVYFDGKEYYMLKPKQVNGKYTFQRVYIKVPKGIKKDKVQQYIAGRFSGKVIAKDKPIKDKLYYEFHKFKNFKYEGPAELPGIKKEKKEKDIAEAVKFVKAGEQGPHSFSADELEKARKEVAKEKREEELKAAQLEAANIVKHDLEQEKYLRHKERLERQAARYNINFNEFKTLDDIRDLDMFYNNFIFNQTVDQMWKIWKDDLKTIPRLKSDPDKYDKSKAVEKPMREEILSLITPQLIHSKYSGYSEFDKGREKAQLGYGRNLLPPLYNDQIEDYFDKQPEFAGTIASDEINKLPNKIPMGFIMNTDVASGPGEHWVACYINGDSLEYYDPLGDAPDKQFMIDIKKKIEDMNLPVLLKFKVNAVKDQNGNSKHCGYHCIRFLDDRFHGIPYAMTTRYDVNRDGKLDASDDREKSLKEEFKLI